MDNNVPRHTSRRSALGLGLGLTALTATPLGSLLGLSAEASATGHGPAVRPSDPGAYISFAARPGSFALVRNGRAAPILVSDRDWDGVVRVAGDLRSDIERVTGVRPALSHGAVPGAREITVIGTVGRSPLIDGLIARGKLDVSAIRGRWETSLQTVVDKPLPGVDRAFVIAGSDQRGTIFGTYDVSRGIGVSPWYWWDDVAPVHRDEIHVLPGRHSQGTPAVKYRGFFINDENPALGTWAPAYFGPGKAPGFDGGFNAGFYARIFEVMLRLKANYLWPAVWGRAFAEDDPLNHATAKAYGVVMGTSHEAPMMRGIEEWNRHAVAAVRDSSGAVTVPGHDPYGGTGEWSFRRNAEAIKAYWADGIRRMKEEDFEGVVTLGMRGNGDVSLPDGDGIELMTEIIATQRQILAEVSGRDVTTIPQVWTLYKEVQHYWDRGLRVPDDVTVVLTDDNWANIRKLPDLGNDARAGGYGLYYHFDYVGVGRNYKWVDTASLPNMWDQLHQSVAYGNHGLWVTNAGDLKGNELPTQFFLEYAWNPERWTLDRLPEWEEQYARQNFGEHQAAAVAEVLRTYARLQSRRKPELLNRKITLDPAKDPAEDSSAIVYDDGATPFSIVDYRELERVTEEWRTLGAEAERVGRRLPASAQDAWYELVGYEVLATANLYALRAAEFTNLHYARQGRALTNDLAAAAEARLADDLALAARFNTQVAGGKWQGFQTQPHIDYGDVARYGPNAPWQQPEIDNVALKDVLFPAVKRIELPSGAEMGVAVDGSAGWWPHERSAAVLPVFSPYQSQPAQYIEVFNRGRAPFGYRVRTGAPWLIADRVRGRVDRQDRITLRVDWDRAPEGVTEVPVTVSGPDGPDVVVTAVVDRPAVSRSRLDGFVEANGYVSIEADHYSRAVGAHGISWQRIPDIGRTGAGMEPFPVTAARQAPGGAGPRLEYRVSLFTTGPVTVHAYLSPRNNPLPTDGLTYAVSFDDAAPQTVNVTKATGADDGTMNPQWARHTSDNVNITETVHHIGDAGVHVLKFWMVDPTVVLQNLVVDTGGLKPSYLGPPESLRLH
ncbi:MULTISPECIES: glycosyl hydrolase 115 family protein [unclassified Streptomyces]|uniref:glycosyl hydrolase 115 family protein n=1 Tax=unclassified Streptomyces TaxID=2593676 RepID=UPI00224E7612|nr:MULTISPECIES: glycosyl hydrolase 115 family protein [unclassified Streptomyces]MCX5138541.1 glycosyl hydrolase 115 family protein [Streptomyces sp. NBC_00338]